MPGSAVPSRPRRSVCSRPRRCVAGVLLALTVLAGCGVRARFVQVAPASAGTTSPSPTSGATPTPTPPATSTSATAPPPPPSSAIRHSEPPPTVHVPAQAELQAALMTTADLAGFRLGHDAANTAQGGCAALDSGLDAGAGATAEVLFEQNAGGPFLRERLIQYAAGAAATAVSVVRGSPSRCPSFVITDPTLGKIDYTVTALPFGGYGDETAAVRLTAKPQAYPTITSFENLVVVRHGSTLIMIAHTGVNSIDNAFTATAVGRAYDKVKTRW